MIRRLLQTYLVIKTIIGRKEGIVGEFDLAGLLSIGGFYCEHCDEEEGRRVGGLRNSPLCLSNPSHSIRRPFII